MFIIVNSLILWNDNVVNAQLSYVGPVAQQTKPYKGLFMLLLLIRYYVENVLLLKNQLNLSDDASELSQEKLISLLSERLLDLNSNVNVRFLTSSV